MISKYLCALLVVFVSANASAQSLPYPNAPHPETGEPGVWIPQWLERQHVLDDDHLATCHASLGLLEREGLAARDAFEELKLANLELNEIVDENDARELALRQTLLAVDRKLERRTRLVWGLTGTTVTVLGAFALLLWAR